jgi:hypothetical protein
MTFFGPVWRIFSCSSFEHCSSSLLFNQFSIRVNESLGTLQAVLSNRMATMKPNLRRSSKEGSVLDRIIYLLHTKVGAGIA